MTFRSTLRAIAGAALVAAVAGCADSATEAPPPAALAAASGFEADAKAACGSWSCSWNVCGWDPARDPRGACCTGGTTGDAVPKPSCDPGFVITPNDPSYYPADYCLDGSLHTQTCSVYCDPYCGGSCYCPVDGEP